MHDINILICFIAFDIFVFILIVYTIFVLSFIAKIHVAWKLKGNKAL